MKTVSVATNITSRSPYLAALDGLRGVAAVLIVQRHSPEFFGPELGSTYLGLDMFFCLSGFVVANAYEQRLQNRSMTLSRFILLRLIRFWPLYLTATVIMAFGVIAKGSDAANVLLSAALNAFFIPTPETLSGSPALFPVLFVAWSLFWELLFCIIYGVLAPRLTMHVLIALLLASFCALCVTGVTFGSLNAGFYWSSFWAGGSRMAFAFSAGVLVFRLRPQFTSGNTIGWISVAVLGVVLITPVTPEWRVSFDLAVASLVLPGVIWVASSSEMTHRSAAVLTAMGAASYPLYLLHIPAFRFGEAILEPQGASAIFQGVALVALLLPLCWAVDRYFDLPVRKAIMRHRTRASAGFLLKVTPHKA